MDLLQGVYQDSRKKIYSGPGDASTNPSPVNMGVIETKSEWISSQEVALQYQKFREIIREKELQLMQLKHEKTLLKQIERRQQKDIEAIEIQMDEAPKMIKALQDELTRQKHKLKKYFAQISDDSRQIRLLDDERRQLKEQNQKLEKLNQEKNLLERSLLLKKLDDANLKIKELNEKITETSKKFDLEEKNLIGDNRFLRGKIHSMEKEILLLRDRTVVLDDVIREKDKAIASLSIYRYNAIHRKVEAICKKCLKREKAESELKRKNAILEKLPELMPPALHLSSSTAVIVTVTLPGKKTKSGNPIEFSRLTLIYSDDPGLQANVHKVLVDLDTDPGMTRKAPLSRLPSMDKEGIDNFLKEEIKAEEEKMVTKKVKVTNLESGKFYFFQLVAGYLDVEGTPTKIESVFVDGFPMQVAKPCLLVETKPPSITLTFHAAPCTGSPVQVYRIYHSNDASMQESFLIGELQANHSDTKTENDAFKFIYDAPQLKVPHYFKVSAVNAMGEGPTGEPSQCGLIDYVPNQPTKPMIHKLSPTSVQIVSNVVPNGGSDIEKFLIEMFKLSGLEKEKTEIIVDTNRNQLEHIIESLEPDTTYEFQISAMNCVGTSDKSLMSDSVNLDALVPRADIFKFEVTSPTSVKLILPDMSLLEKPKIVAFRIVWSETSDIRNPYVSTMRIPVSATFVIDKLQHASSYYFSISYIGEHDEGLYSPVVFVPLASALSLPESPPPEPNTEAPLPPLSRTGSYRSSTLSLEQKYQNMHDGVPAHFDADMTRSSQELSKQAQPNQTKNNGSNSRLNQLKFMSKSKDSIKMGSFSDLKRPEKKEEKPVGQRRASLATSKLPNYPKATTNENYRDANHRKQVKPKLL